MRILFALCFLASLLPAAAQPVTAFGAYFDFVAERLVLRYDLGGVDSAEVGVLLSDDGGKTFLVPLPGLTGDVGLVGPGTGREIRWDAPGPLNLLTHRVKLVVRARTPVDLALLAAQVDSSRLRADLAWLAGTRHALAGPARLAAVKDSLETRFARAGLQTSRQAKVLFGGYTLENILGRLPGTRDERRTFLLDGHFDTVANTPGADDNASAVAALLECLRILCDTGFVFDHTLKFVGFDQEEAGLLGSIHYAATVGIPAYEDLAGVFNLEMIGYYDDRPGTQTFPAGFDLLFPGVYSAVQADSARGNFLLLAGNAPAAPLMQAFDSLAGLYVSALHTQRLQVPGNGSLVPDLRRSDHAPFWDLGLPALMLNDAADFRNPHYHTPGDSVGTLHLPFMYQTVQATLLTLAHAAGIHRGQALVVSIAAGVPTATDPDPACLPRWTVQPGRRLQVYLPCAGLDHHLHVYDIAGRALWHHSGREAQHSIDLPRAGIYLVEYQQGSRRQTFKVAMP